MLHAHVPCDSPVPTEHYGKAADSLEVSSPALSDEEYLSPQEEAMEVGDLPAPSKSVHFKELPSFQVGQTEYGFTF